ncbi:MAG: hypothetical protein ABW047_08230 [Nitrospiraceae bacterium]
MKIRRLGCHGTDQMVTSFGGPLTCGTSSWLFNDTSLLDVGTKGSRLFFEEQKRIGLVLLTPLHVDHMRDLPTWVGSLVSHSDIPIVVADIPAVFKGLGAHSFDGEGSEKTTSFSLNRCTPHGMV